MDATLQYELRPSDVEAFFHHHASSAPYIVARNRRMRWVRAALFALLALLYSARSAIGSAIFVAFAVVYAVFYARLYRWWYVRYNRRINSGPDQPRLGRTTLELTGGELHVEAPEGSSQVPPSAVRRIDESQSHYFVYLSPVAALIVPKRAQEAETFIQLLRSWAAAA